MGFQGALAHRLSADPHSPLHLCPNRLHSGRQLRLKLVLPPQPRSNFELTCASTAATHSERLGIARKERVASGSTAEPSTGPASLREEARQDKKRVCDKLIAVFQERPPHEWRKLIAHSKQWPSLSESLFRRIDERVAVLGEDAKAKTELRKLGRKLRSVHEELGQYNKTLASFMDTHPDEWESMVAASRIALTTEFFDHMENLIHAAVSDKARQEELVSAAMRLMALIEAFDKVAANQDAMQAAAVEFDSLLQVGSMAEAEKRIDVLAESGKLDPALLLTMARAHAAARDTDYTKEEVKDVMAHLYFKAKESFAKLQPPEVRILKHLLQEESSTVRLELLGNAFMPGPELETVNQDFLTTTPDALLTVIDVVLQAYENNKGKTTMIGDAGSLMNPTVIERMRELQQQIRRHY